jgi:C4-type Zn-finger protein
LITLILCNEVSKLWSLSLRNLPSYIYDLCLEEIPYNGKILFDTIQGMDPHWKTVMISAYCKCSFRHQDD